MKNTKTFIIDITGSSGSGKTTAAKLIGKKYKLSVLYSGLLFRFAAKSLLQKKPKYKIKFLKEKFSRLNYEKIKKMKLHTPEISNYTAESAKKLAVRKVIKSFQINYLRKKRKIVLEGRDGSKIFPRANVKFYVVCSPIKIAAKRRLKQIKKVNKKIDLKEVLKDLKKRDFMDKNRKHSKLERHPESVYINTANLSINSVIKKMSDIIDTKIQKLWQ